MKKTFFIIASIMGFFFVTGVTSAQMGMMGRYWESGVPQQQSVQQTGELDTALKSIYTAQHVSTQAQLDCSKITDDQFETLGDAYMGIMVPNQPQHQAMDTMMGGEGSASLRQAHINMGRSYLGCWSSYNSAPVYIPAMGGYGMMGGYGWGFNAHTADRWNVSYWVTLGLVWILLGLGIFAIIRWLLRSSETHQKN